MRNTMLLKKIVLFTFFLACSISFSATMASTPQKYFFSTSLGPSWTNSGEGQTIYFESDLLKGFEPTNLNNSNLMFNGEFFFGIEKQYFKKIQSEFGLAVYISTPAKLNGYILEDASPELINYKYQYKISHEHFVIKSKWITENDYQLNPYISGSIGLGFNYSYHYQESPLLYQEPSFPGFQSRFNTSFIYSVGVGFRRPINEHFFGEVGYQLVSWGASGLNKASGQPINDSLKLSNLISQGIEFTLTYLK